MMSLFNKLLRAQRTPNAASEYVPDFYAVGYPKTGNTWTRILLGKYIQIAHGLDEMPLFDPVEMVELKAQGYEGATGEFTHSPLSWEDQKPDDLTEGSVVAPFAGRKVILLTRHPLDTLVSSFMHAKHKVVPPYDGDLVSFIQDPVRGLDKLLRFHQIWARHHGETRAFYLMRYEDTHVDPASQLRRLLAFLGEEIDETALTEAVDFAAFDNLRAAEKKGLRLVYKSSGFNAFGDGEKTDPNAFHVRKGEIGGYRSELPADQIAELETRIASKMPKLFGYS